jgi:hypothetical protein
VVNVGGWILEDNVLRFLTYLSAYIGYRYDWWDEQALVGALDHTDDRSPKTWFSYPLAGRPPLTVRLARSLGSAVVTVQVTGDIDAVLAARISTLLDVFTDPPQPTGSDGRPTATS